MRAARTRQTAERRQRRRDHTDIARLLKRIDAKHAAVVLRACEQRVIKRRRHHAQQRRAVADRACFGGALSVSTASGTTNGRAKIAPRITVANARRKLRQSAPHQRQKVERGDRRDQVDQQQDTSPQADHQQQRTREDIPPRVPRVAQTQQAVQSRALRAIASVVRRAPRQAAPETPDRA